MSNLRIQQRNEAPIRTGGDYVLYWMIATRRVRWNFALDRAVGWSRELAKPLLVLEALRSDYRWAADRIHRFILDGMADNQAALEEFDIGYFPYVESEIGEGKGLLEALSERAAVVVTDEFPTFFLPRMVEAAASRLDVKLEAVDSNGLLPIRAADRCFTRAYDFRRFLQKRLPEYLDEFPAIRLPDRGSLPAFGGVPTAIADRWPRASQSLLSAGASVSDLPIDHQVAPIEERGGYEAGQRVLRRFLDDRLPLYGEERNQPEVAATSGLSPYLHFGHVSAHQILDAIARREEWGPWKLGDDRQGARKGWWNLEASTESFLDELVTWRELGDNFCFHRPDHAEYAALSDWARESLAEHAGDDRPYLYSLEEFEQAQTHDDLWNAAQNELRETGRIHNYLRMLWGKKILHWSRSPQEALDIMIELNNKYAIDGRNPNSYTGILWVLGRFDRAWGPERPVFGKVRYMSSRNTRRKIRVNGYIQRWTSPIR
jgi:deoxyribodipyrimidine photo-lyase